MALPIDPEKEKVLRAILFTENLPVIPALAARLIAMLNDSETSLKDVSELICMDAGLSGKILKIVNSAYYGFVNPVISVHQAVNLMGMNAVQNLVLSVAFFSLKERNDIVFDYREFWHGSLARAVAARIIFSRLDLPNNLNGEQVFLTGLLQNLGKLILASTMNEQYQEVQQRLTESAAHLEDDDVELEVLGVDHSLTSYRLACEWGLPDSLALPLRYHHCPLHYDGDDENIRINALLCHLADRLGKILEGKNPQYQQQIFKELAIAHLNLQVSDINEILQSIHHEIDSTAQVFGLNLENTRSVEEILIEANIKLSLLNMSYDEINRKLLDQQVQLEKLTRELEEKNRLLESLAYRDGLTGVNNHRYFQNFLDAELSRALRNPEAWVGLLLLDIDRFKLFNDTHGHRIGDYILIEFCQVVAEQIRGHDMLARYGGEEFVIVLPETDLDGALTVAERIRHRVEKHAFMSEGESYKVTISIGVASCQPKQRGFTKDQFIRAADRALYTAKNGGRNRVEAERVFDQP